jgi:hypothetical protein
MTAVKGDHKAAIARLEKTLIWRRTENIDDLEAMADSCEPEVCSTRGYCSLQLVIACC